MKLNGQVLNNNGTLQATALEFVKNIITLWSENVVWVCLDHYIRVEINNHQANIIIVYDKPANICYDS